MRKRKMIFEAIAVTAIVCIAVGIGYFLSKPLDLGDIEKELSEGLRVANSGISLIEQGNYSKAKEKTAISSSHISSAQYYLNSAKERGVKGERLEPYELIIKYGDNLVICLKDAITTIELSNHIEESEVKDYEELRTKYQMVVDNVDIFTTNLNNVRKIENKTIENYPELVTMFKIVKSTENIGRLEKKFSYKDPDDLDRDGLSNIDELLFYRSNPLDKDSDKDSRDTPLLFDGAEVTRGMNPTRNDSDCDGIGDYEEFIQRMGCPYIADIPLLSIDIRRDVNIVLTGTQSFEAIDEDARTLSYETSSRNIDSHSSLVSNEIDEEMVHELVRNTERLETIAREHTKSLSHKNGRELTTTMREEFCEENTRKMVEETVEKVGITTEESEVERIANSISEEVCDSFGETYESQLTEKINEKYEAGTTGEASVSVLFGLLSVSCPAPEISGEWSSETISKVTDGITRNSMTRSAEESDYENIRSNSKKLANEITNTASYSSAISEMIKTSYEVSESIFDEWFSEVMNIYKEEVSEKIGFKEAWKRGREERSSITESAQVTRENSSKSTLSEFIRAKNITKSDISGGKIMTEVTISNVGDTPTELSNIHFILYVGDYAYNCEHIFRNETITLDPLLTPKCEDVVTFKVSGLEATDLIDLIDGGQGFSVEVGYYEMTDESGRKWAWYGGEISKITIETTIDCGDGDVKKVFVVGDVSTKGISAAQVLKQLKSRGMKADIIDSYTIDENGSLYELNGKRVGENNGSWLVEYGKIPRIYHGSLNRLMLQSGDKIIFTYVKDSDGDGILDRVERKYGTSLTNPDTDGDDLTDYEEIYKYKTNPCWEDTDSGGESDGSEIQYERDPNNPKDDFTIIIPPIVSPIIPPYHHIPPHLLPYLKEPFSG